MIKNGEMETVRFEVTEAARNNRVHDRGNVQIKIFDEISLQQPPAKYSSTCHVSHVLVFLTNSTS